LHVSFEHGHSHHESVGEVVDFSGEGVALAVDAGAALYLSGDPIPRVRIFQNDTTFYDGAAVIRNIRESDGRTIIGLAFQNSFMDLGKVYHLDLRRDLEQRFGAFFSDLRALNVISSRFKAWVADTKYTLDQLRARLLAEEQRISPLDWLTREAIANETVDLVSESVLGHMGERIGELNQLVDGFDESMHDLHRSYFQHHLRHLFIESPFAERCFSKPLGYAGDYELMNMLYRDHREGRSLFGRVLNVFSCSLSAARANINRVIFLRGELAKILRGKPRASIASVGCGPAREINELIVAHPELEGYDVTLLDIEPRAVQYCEKVLLSRLRETGRRVQMHFIRESVRELIRQRRLDSVLNPQDVVVSAGLFDYFGDKMFQRLLLRMYELLKPGGHLYVGNVNTTNDSRIMMEYMAEWFLHHRSPDDLRALATVLPSDARAEVVSEPSGVNLFLHVIKAGGEEGSSEESADGAPS
jgi:extracellular factor (EF) 3-hydroxypalmitic acid methyl ester biosynthesis protein